MKLYQIAMLAALFAFLNLGSAGAIEIKNPSQSEKRSPLTASFITCSAYEATSAEQASDCYRHVVELAAKSYDDSKFSRLEEASYIEGALDGAREVCNLGKAFVKDHPRNNAPCTLKFNKAIARSVVNAFDTGSQAGPYNPDLK